MHRGREGETLLRGTLKAYLVEQEGDMVARESIILAAREVVVLILVVGVLAWVGYQFVRDARR
ncbi:MAG: hypothetical protein QOI23_497 [Chloroflexota bacterium]|nr:hypothetical protein [Solirubrobacterales bacterium]MEA2655132.1 hypothetical protein [Chloroflexota bacterium]